MRLRNSRDDLVAFAAPGYAGALIRLTNPTRIAPSDVARLQEQCDDNERASTAIAKREVSFLAELSSTAFAVLMRALTLLPSHERTPDSSASDPAGAKHDLNLAILAAPA